MALLRYGLPSVLAATGIAFLCFGNESTRYDMFAMCVGSALALLALTFFIRLGAEGDKERDKEEEARRFLMEHGHWPDEPPPASRRP